eukprot:6211987-Pleurochrysis_carterae.AAC.4
MLVLPSWNKLIIAKELHVHDAVIRSRPITSADMQGTNARYGQTSISHPVCCKCRKGECQQHDAYCSHAVESNQEMLNYTKKVGCEMKTFDEMCCFAHYRPPSMARGGKFKRFECPCCGHTPF